MMYFNRIFIGVFCVFLSFFLVSCSDNKEEEKKIEAKKMESYIFIESKAESSPKDSNQNTQTKDMSDKKYEIVLPEVTPNKDSSKKDSNVKILISPVKSGENATQSTAQNSPKDTPKARIIALFSKDCKASSAILGHLNNLGFRLKDIDIFVLNERRENIGSNAFLANNINVFNLYSGDNKFTFLLDSIKRKLNMEIKDFEAPIFLLLKGDNSVVKSIEGLVVEEILEIEIKEILANQ